MTLTMVMAVLRPSPLADFVSYHFHYLVYVIELNMFDFIMESFNLLDMDFQDFVVFKLEKIYTPNSNLCH